MPSAREESSGASSSTFATNLDHPDPDELRHLRDGDTYMAPNGNRYRVHKTVFSQKSASGPHGEGDPDDRTLRRLEADVIIPNLMNREIERVACKESYLGLVNCIRHWGDILALAKCKNPLHHFNICKKEKFEDLEFRQMITDRYLNERAEHRRTGLSPNMRRLKAYREWKQQQNSANQAS